MKSSEPDHSFNGQSFHLFNKNHFECAKYFRKGKKKINYRINCHFSNGIQKSISMGKFISGPNRKAVHINCQNLNVKTKHVLK